MAVDWCITTSMSWLPKVLRDCIVQGTFFDVMSSLVPTDRANVQWEAKNKTKPEII